MNLCMIGCTHHDSNIDQRQQLAFQDHQVVEALEHWRNRFPTTELALLSTCNRVELYAAGLRDLPAPEDFIDALLSYHGLQNSSAGDHLIRLQEGDAAAHLFRVAASLDSMVLGEPQILAQVKQAYRLAQASNATGPFLHDLFQSAVRTAKRVHRETDLHKHRVSIPSVAIADFASRVFERFDDKHILVIGAGEMAAETIRYLRDAGAQRIFVINRDPERAKKLAAAHAGKAVPWESLWAQLAAADLVVSTTAAERPIVDADAFDQRVAPLRQQRALFVLDLAVPRDFDPAVSDRLGVYLYTLDDLQVACDRNRLARAEALPAAERIVVEEANRFLASARHRTAAPVITGLRRNMEDDKQAELARLFNKLSDLDERQRIEIEQFADRLVNKMLHPPLKSIRDASENGAPHGLLDALRRIFRVED